MVTNRHFVEISHVTYRELDELKVVMQPVKAQDLVVWVKSRGWSSDKKKEEQLLKKLCTQKMAF